MKIIEFKESVHERLWSSFISDFPSATIYHTRQWAKVLKKTFGFEEKSLIYINNGRIEAILPLWKVSRSCIVNSPLRDRADLIASSQSIEQEVSQYLSKIDCDLIIKDWNRDSPSDDFFLEQYWLTSVLDLSSGKDMIWSKVDKAARRNVERAKNNGIVIIQSVNYKNMIDFYRLFKGTRKRLGVPIYSWSFFENMLNILERDSLRIYIGYLFDKPISGVIVFDSLRLSIYAYGASDNKYHSTRVNDLIFWRAIEDSINLGKVYFDFGADSPDQKSLLQFKRKWGTCQKILPTIYRKKTKIDFEKIDFSSKRYAVHRRILSYLPERILVGIGSFMAKRYR